MNPFILPPETLFGYLSLGLLSGGRCGLLRCLGGGLCSGSGLLLLCGGGLLRRCPEGLNIVRTYASWKISMVTYQVVTEKLHDEGGVLVALLREGVQFCDAVSP